MMSNFPQNGASPENEESFGGKPNIKQSRFGQSTAPQPKPRTEITAAATLPKNYELTAQGPSIAPAPKYLSLR